MDICYLFTTQTIPTVRITTTTSSISITGITTPIITFLLLLSSSLLLPPVLEAGLLLGITTDVHIQLLVVLCDLSVALTSLGTGFQVSCPLSTPDR